MKVRRKNRGRIVLSQDLITFILKNKGFVYFELLIKYTLTNIGVQQRVNYLQTLAYNSV